MNAFRATAVVDATFQAQWRDRLASGSKLAAKALAQALKEDAARVGAAARLTADPHPAVRCGSLRALADVARADPAAVAPHAREVVEGLAAPEADAQEAALEALASIASRAPEEVALALPLVADALAAAKRPSVRESAARCLGRLGSEVPAHAPAAAHSLVARIPDSRSPRAAQEAREILAALEGLLPNLPPPERAAIAPRIAPLRGHPNIQVRERAGRIARQLAA